MAWNGNYKDLPAPATAADWSNVFAGQSVPPTPIYAPPSPSPPVYRNIPSPRQQQATPSFPLPPRRPPELDQATYGPLSIPDVNNPNSNPNSGSASEALFRSRMPGPNMPYANGGGSGNEFGAMSILAKALLGMR